jgi:hypothetical protein
MRPRREGLGCLRRRMRRVSRCPSFNEAEARTPRIDRCGFGQAAQLRIHNVKYRDKPSIISQPTQDSAASGANQRQHLPEAKVPSQKGRGTCD